MRRTVAGHDPGRNAFDAVRREWNAEGVVLGINEGETGIARVAVVAGTEGGHSGRRRRRQCEQRAETALVLIVVQLDEDSLIRELALEVPGRRRPRAMQSADERSPVGAVGVDAPDGPQEAVAQA